MSKFIKLPIIKDSDYRVIVFCEHKIFAIRPYPEMPEELTPVITLEEAAKREDVVQFGIKFNDFEEPRKMIELLKKEFPMLGGNQNRNFLDINMNYVNKKYGVEQLIKLMNWQSSPVLVIGDDLNDLPMIKHFKGYTVERAAKFMHEAATKVYKSVGDMLMDNM